MSKYKIFARVKGDQEWKTRPASEGAIYEMIITRGNAEPITVEVIVEESSTNRVPSVDWVENRA